MRKHVFRFWNGTKFYDQYSVGEEIGPELYGWFGDVTFQQATGLVDLCGKNIYEGDLVLTSYDFDDERFPLEIRWEQNCARFNYCKLRSDIFYSYDNILHSHKAKYNTLIIGNNLENPEIINWEEPVSINKWIADHNLTPTEPFSY